MAAVPATLAPLAVADKVTSKSSAVNSAADGNSFGDTLSAQVHSLSQRAGEGQGDSPAAPADTPAAVAPEATAGVGTPTTGIPANETSKDEVPADAVAAGGMDPALFAVLGLNPAAAAPVVATLGTPQSPDALPGGAKLQTPVLGVAGKTPVIAELPAQTTDLAQRIASTTTATEIATTTAADPAATAATTSEFSGVLTAQTAKIADSGKFLPANSTTVADVTATPTNTGVALQSVELPKQAVMASAAVTAPGVPPPNVMPPSEDNALVVKQGASTISVAPVTTSSTTPAEVIVQQAVAADISSPLKVASANSEFDLPVDLHVSSAPSAPIPHGLANAGQANNTTPSVQTPVSLHVPVPVQSPDWSESVGNKVIWMSNQNTQVAEMQLNPPNLGPMEVRLTIQQDQATLSFVSQNASVREALQNAIPKLNEMLANTGLNLGSVQVGAESFQQADQNAFAQQQFQRRDRRDAAEPGFGTDTVTKGETTIRTISRVGGNGKVDLFA